MKGNGRNISDSHFPRGFLHGSQHCRGIGTQRDEIHAIWCVVGAEDAVLMGKDTGFNPGKRSAECRDFGEIDWFFCEKKGLDCLLGIVWKMCWRGVCDRGERLR